MYSQYLLLAFSLIVLSYWFRHHCASVLRTKASREIARDIAEANHLNFAEIEARAGTANNEQLHEFDVLLGRDYRVLIALIRYTAPPHGPHFTFSQRMLRLDFTLNRAWYHIVARRLRRQARRAIQERSRILVHFANVVGERSAVPMRS